MLLLLLSLTFSASAALTPLVSSSFFSASLMVVALAIAGVISVGEQQQQEFGATGASRLGWVAEMRTGGKEQVCEEDIDQY